MLPHRQAFVNSFLLLLKIFACGQPPHQRGCLFIVSYFPKNIKAFCRALPYFFAEFKAVVLSILTENLRSRL